MYESQGVYMRDFSNGLAIVNPPSTNQTAYIILPAGFYQDLYGNKYQPADSWTAERDGAPGKNRAYNRSFLGPRRGLS